MTLENLPLIETALSRKQVETLRVLRELAEATAALSSHVDELSRQLEEAHEAVAA